MCILAWFSPKLHLALLLGFSNCYNFVQHLLRVVPVIGILNNKKAFQPAPNPAEVEVIFDAPLEMFIKVFPLLTLSNLTAML